MPQSVDAAFKEAWRRFGAVDIDSARIDARLLMGAVLGGGVERVLAERDRDLTPDESQLFDQYVKRRESFEPISQILGEKEFWSLPFKVTPATLTPRPDTETIVEAALETVDTPPKRLLDLGTGSGCIVLALLSEWKQTEGVGVDASPEALAVAMENADILGLLNRTTFHQADWRLKDWQSDLGGLFDVVVSNPPYIPDGDIEGLDADVRTFEPLSALAGGKDGLNAYREIIAELPNVLAKGGLVVFEVGIGQADDVLKLLVFAGFEKVEKRQDLAGIARAIMARRV